MEIQEEIELIDPLVGQFHEGASFENNYYKLVCSIKTYIDVNRAIDS